MKRAERLHALSEALRRTGTRGCSAECLTTEFDVSVRTIKRDLAALESSGLPLWSRPGPGGGYGVAANASLPPVSLSPAQAVALMAAVSAASDAPYSDLAAAGVRKILDVLDPATRERAHQLAGRIWVTATAPTSFATSAAPAAPATSRVLRTVRSVVEEAMSKQKVVRIRYITKEGVTSYRDVEPVLFASRDGRWYLVGWCRARDAMRWFTLTRIQ